MQHKTAEDYANNRVAYQSHYYQTVTKPKRRAGKVEPKRTISIYKLPRYQANKVMESDKEWYVRRRGIGFELRCESDVLSTKGWLKVVKNER
jgi:hypothetical protein